MACWLQVILRQFWDKQKCLISIQEKSNWKFPENIFLDYKKSQFPRVEAVMILSAFDVKIRELPLYVMPLRIYFFRFSIFLHKDTML